MGQGCQVLHDLVDDIPVTDLVKYLYKISEVPNEAYASEHE